MLMSVALSNVRMPLCASTTCMRPLDKSLYAQRNRRICQGILTPSESDGYPSRMRYSVPCVLQDAKRAQLACAMLCCAVLCCAVLCCAVLCCASVALFRMTVKPLSDKNYKIIVKYDKNFVNPNRGFEKIL